MAKHWRFVESDPDGAHWLESPDELTSCVEFESADAEGTLATFRLMIVTRGWLEKHLLGVRESRSGPLWAGVPSMVVVPDATGEQLKGFVDRVMSDGSLAYYATRIT